jgi:hypothetical protein
MFPAGRAWLTRNVLIVKDTLAKDEDRRKFFPAFPVRQGKIQANLARSEWASTGARTLASLSKYT